MRNTLYTKFLLAGAFCLTLSACDSDDNTTSVITSFDKYPITTEQPAVVTQEVDEEVKVFTFKLDPAKQVTNVTVEVQPGPSSTATEGVDYELSAHSFPLLAFQGQDGFDLEIQILQDGEIEPEDETIYLTFTTTDPSGVETEEMLAVTIQDSGVAASLDVEVGWPGSFEVDGEEVDFCDVMDLDFYLYDSEESSIIGNDAATASCPEGFTVPADTPDGSYELYVNFWQHADMECTDQFGNEYSCFPVLDVPLELIFTRGVNEKVVDLGVVTSTASTAWYAVGETNAVNPYVEYYLGTLVVSGGKFTFNAFDGGTSGEMRRATIAGKHEMRKFEPRQGI